MEQEWNGPEKKAGTGQEQNGPEKKAGTGQLCSVPEGNAGIRKAGRWRGGSCYGW